MKFNVISVVMITYGHEKYIREAIQGVLMQQCKYPLELIIADDASLDNTQQVVESFKNHLNYHWIKYTKHQKNKGMMPNFLWAVSQAQGKYIALCEGDDYWTDPYKLQKQVDFLEANPEYVLCFHPVKVLQPNGELVDDFITKVPENYETQETLARLGNYIHTPSVVFKNVLQSFPPEMALSPIGDYYLYMLLSEHGMLKCLNEVMGVYRYGVGVIKKMNDFQIACNNILMYTCMIGVIQDFKIRSILMNRQTKIIEAYRDTFQIKKQETSNSLHFNFKKFVRKLKNILDKTIKIF